MEYRYSRKTASTPRKRSTFLAAMLLCWLWVVVATLDDAPWRMGAEAFVVSPTRVSPRFLPNRQPARAGSPNSGLQPLAEATSPDDTSDKGGGSTTTRESSSLGRLKFCYERLQLDCPDDAYLRSTPAITLGRELTVRLMSAKQFAREEGKDRMPEVWVVAVLDVYMVAYRQAQKKFPDKTTLEYRQAMDKVIEGMIDTLYVLLDPNNTEGKQKYPPRSVDPYATVLHTMLELVLDFPFDAVSVPHYYRTQWCYKATTVLSFLEMNTEVAKNPAHVDARVVCYNKVLKALAATPSTVESAVLLLDKMRGLKFEKPPPDPENPFGRKPDDPNEAWKQTIFEDLRDGRYIGDHAGVAPDAKSYATVLGSPHIGREDSERLLEASQQEGLYEGYLERFVAKLPKR